MGQEDHDVPWVIKHFRPLLEKIDIDNIPEEPHYQIELLSDVKQYIQLGMEDCVLAICRRHFISRANGFYTFSHAEYEGQRIFFLNIYINNNLFVSDSPDFRERRRRTIIHEFTHCIAAFLSLGRIKTELLIAGLTKKLVDQVRVNAMTHYQFLLNQFGNPPARATYNTLGIFPDEHFRLGYEDFEHSFSVVYKQLILDRIIFEKYFTEDLRKRFFAEIKKKNTQDALAILWQANAALIATEAISADFLSLRLMEEFLEYYCQKAV